ncbi:MAG: helix-turn-helix domain-containing protein [Planctomycetota bacterium]
MTTKDAAKYTGFSVKTITRYCRDGVLKHSRVGKRGDYRFRHSWLEGLLEQQATGPSHQPASPPRIQPRLRSETLARILQKQSA